MVLHSPGPWDRPLALWVTPLTGTLNSFSACSQKRLLTWDTWVSRQGVTVQLNTQKPNSLNPSAAHTPMQLIHYLICLDGSVPSWHLSHGKDATWALGEELAKAGRSWGIGVLQGGPLWIFPLAWLSDMIFSGLDSHWAPSWTSLSNSSGTQELCVSYQGPCTDSSCSLSFQEERGSDRGPGVWFCIALPDKNILSLCGITENFNSIPKTSLPSQSIFLALSILGSSYRLLQHNLQDWVVLAE